MDPFSANYYPLTKTWLVAHCSFGFKLAHSLSLQNDGGVMVGWSVETKPEDVYLITVNVCVSTGLCQVMYGIVALLHFLASCLDIICFPY